MHGITLDDIKIKGLPAGQPDHVEVLDISNTKTVQIGYQAETLYLYPAEDDKLTIKEFTGGLSGSEYYAKVSSNRFKTTVRYGRRETVNTDTCVEIYIPKDFHNELQLSSQYGSIITESDWVFERFAAETTEGTIFLKTIEAPRIRLASSVGTIQIDHSIGFTDIHSVSGIIIAKQIDGGGKLNTSDSPILAEFTSLNTVVECESLNGPISIRLPEDTGMEIDAISKRGEITSDIEGLNHKMKPGNVRTASGVLGTKPFQNVRLNNINGSITITI